MPLTSDIIKQYAYNHVFVETGTMYGHGVELAKRAGFAEIHSIEIMSDLYARACLRFKYCDKVILHLGDSCDILAEVIKDIDEPITFWLDAHDKKFNSSLLAELAIIACYPANRHTILIDDVEDFEDYGISIEKVECHLRRINSAYKMTQIKAKRTILVAE